MRQTFSTRQGIHGKLTRVLARRTEGLQTSAIAVALKTPAGEVIKSGQCEGGILSWDLKTGDVDLWYAPDLRRARPLPALAVLTFLNSLRRYPIRYGAQPIYHVEVSLIGTVRR